MSNIERVDNLKQIVRKIEPQFNELARIHGAVNFEREASFALQLLNDSDFLFKIAMGNQDSLRQAVLNVAAIGLSLSPVHKWAYLVPRDKKICLDISYRGFIQLATDIQSIKWAQADVVHEKDEYQFQGLGQAPIHKFNPFGARGKIVGAYCLVKTIDNDNLVTQMSIDEIYSLRDRYSMSWRAYKKDGTKTPWVTDEAEMIKKTVVRRAYKMWPMTKGRDRFDTAIDITKEQELPSLPAAAPEDKRAIEIAKVRGLLVDLKREETKFLDHAIRVFKRDLKSLDDLTDMEISQVITVLSAWAERERKKATNENAG